MAKKILITGAGSGFGLGAALKLKALGQEVVGTVQNDAQFKTLTSAGIEAIEVDITNPAQIARLAGVAPDVLLNNAGAGQLGPLATIGMDKVRQVFEVNVFGTLQVTQAVLPSMQARGSGRIIIVSSIAGVFSGLLSGPYAMTKHALEAMTKSLAAEMKPYGIEVCKLNPGPYATGFNDAMVEGVDKMLLPESTEGGFAKLTRERMLGNQLDPVEIEDTMVQLCLADDVPFETFKPDNILDRYKAAR
ncbi:MAG: SDR family NAD(P)-dependent oxidoreductase [Burkholderiaceae bacterium]